MPNKGQFTAGAADKLRPPSSTSAVGGLLSGLAAHVKDALVDAAVPTQVRPDLSPEPARLLELTLAAAVLRLSRSDDGLFTLELPESPPTSRLMYKLLREAQVQVTLGSTQLPITDYRWLSDHAVSFRLSEPPRTVGGVAVPVTASALVQEQLRALEPPARAAALPLQIPSLPLPDGPGGDTDEPDTPLARLTAEDALKVLQRMADNPAIVLPVEQQGLQYLPPFMTLMPQVMFRRQDGPQADQPPQPSDVVGGLVDGLTGLEPLTSAQQIPVKIDDVAGELQVSARFAWKLTPEADLLDSEQLTSPFPQLMLLPTVVSDTAREQAPKHVLSCTGTLTCPQFPELSVPFTAQPMLGFRSLLPLPTVVAFYRAPEFGAQYPDWRTMSRDRHPSGACVYAGGTGAAPADLRLQPDVPRPSIISHHAPLQLLDLLSGSETVSGVSAGLGSLRRLYATVHAAGGSMPAPLQPYLQLARAVETLLSSLSELAPSGHEFLQVQPRSNAADIAEADLARALFRDAGMGLAVHVQDEAEAMIVIGLPGTAVELHVHGAFGRDAGVARVEIPADGFAAVIPDLAMAGPEAGDSAPGWFVDGMDDDSAAGMRRHGQVRTAGLPAPGTLRIQERIRSDRSPFALGPDLHGVDRDPHEQQRRMNTPARAISSFRVRPA